MTKDYSTETEKDVLAGILNYPAQIIRYRKILTRDLFHVPSHKAIFDVIHNALSEDRKTDAITVADKIHAHNITDEKGKSLCPYVKSISFNPPEEDSIEELIYQLRDLQYRRDTKAVLKKIESSLNSSKPLYDIHNEINSKWSNEVRLPLANQEKPEKLFKGYIEQLEENAANPKPNDIGYDWPSKLFTDYYGKLRKGAVHVVVARGGQGKTTMLNHVGWHILKEHKIPVLMIDTEMRSAPIKHRLFAALSGAPVYALEENEWWKNEKIKEQVYATANEIDPEADLFHIYVGGKSMEEIEALVLDFYYREVGEGNPFLICYDYIKCDEKSVKGHWGEHQALGDHVDKLHQLAVQTNAVVLTAAQANRSGDSFNRTAGIADDSTAIADSDRIQRYAEMVLILRTKNAKELALDEGMGEEAAEHLRQLRDPSAFRNGTHIATVVKSRHMGRNAVGHLDFVRRRGENGQWITGRNYLCFEINNFNVIEKGDLRSIVAHQNDDTDLDDDDIL
jgi:replicative DNA helicase